MNKILIEKFKAYFTQMNFNNDSLLEEIYSNNVVFVDPIHEIKGITNLKEYFNKLNENLVEGAFTFTEESVIDTKVYLSWDMQLKLKRPKKNS